MWKKLRALMARTPGAPAAPRRAARPRLECLEGRLAPATFLVNTFADVVNPNDGDLVDAFGDWVTDPGMRQKVMVETPGKFYRF